METFVTDVPSVGNGENELRRVEASVVKLADDLPPYCSFVAGHVGSGATDDG